MIVDEKLELNSNDKKILFYIYNMLYCGIDPSLISTAMVIGNNSNNFDIFNYTVKDKVFNKSGMKKWFKMAEENVKYEYVEYRKFKDYSTGEIVKLKDYDLITDKIINNIENYMKINNDYDLTVGIEGYNFGAQIGPLLDLVTFSTLLRKKLFNISKNIIILSPSTLKLESCKLTYTKVENNNNKKSKWRNNQNVSGGRFTKNEMFLAIIENEKFTDKWFKHLIEVKEDIEIVKNIPKPYDDINDAYLIFKIMLNN